MIKFYLPQTTAETQFSQPVSTSRGTVKNLYKNILAISRILIALAAFFVLGMTGVRAQSCSENDAGFNTFVNTNTLTICQGNNTTSVSAAFVTGGATYVWEVATAASTGP
ncbi:MAG: hypothetical protein WKI04_18635, partial [Ferruginibacter sp.]